jgi:DNA-binding protein YbaB
MNQFYKEYEMLSAYIDGELSNDEIIYIEDKLAVSKDLQQKLAELRRVKELSQSSFQNVTESPYFETKLLSNLGVEHSSGFKLKKWIPVVGFSLATIVLMLFLRSNPKFFDAIIEEQKSKLAGLYTENLKPLFISAGLTNEDVFNFALHRKLPIDKDKGQYLFLGTNEDGSEYFEIKTASLADSDNDFDKFVSALDLNEKQKKQIDSILESYAQDMEAQVLVNENNTVAISPKLWNYNKAIFADVMAFAKDCNYEQYDKIVPAAYSKMDKPQLMEIAEVVRSASDSDYIFMTPDTIFIETFRFDRERYDNEMKQMQAELHKNLKEAEKELRHQNFVLKIDENIVKLKKKGSKDNQFEVYIDTNVCRVHIPNMDFDWSQTSVPNFEELEAQINAATKNLQSFTVRVPKEGNIRKKFEVRVDVKDSSQHYNFDFNLPNIRIPVLPDSFLKDSYLYDNEVYRFKADSLSNAIMLMLNDSMIFNQKDFKFQMKEFQKEMRKLREEMLKLQRNFENEKKEVKSDEPIEI